MSHFTVLVVGEDPEEQLAPFHEFECTGNNDKYVQDVDITDEVNEQIGESEEKTKKAKLEDGLEYHGLNDKIVLSEDEVDRDGEHKYGYAIVKSGKLIKAVKRTNPNRKWDWYSLGGRWSGYFKLKAGRNGEVGRPGTFDNKAEAGHVDSARLEDIDLEGMVLDAGVEAGKQYDKVERLLNGIPKLDIHWKDIIAEGNEKYGKLSIDEKRTLYHAQPGKKKLEKAKDNDSLSKDERSLLTWLDLESYQCTRKEYVKRAENSALSTFAVLNKGEWFEKGEMGWWGCVSNEMDQEKWNEEFLKLLKSLPGDTVISVYDCHI